MTFEEYMKDVERFGKITNPDWIESYRRQYENHLQKEEDDNYFEPFDVNDKTVR